MQRCYNIPSFNPFGNRGLSDSAFNLHNQIKDILNNDLSIAVSKEAETELLETLADIYEECKVENWDGYGASRIDENSYNESLRFIHFLPKTFPCPEIAIEPDGEVAFEWSSDKRKVFSVSIGGKGDLIYAGLFGINKTHGTEVFGDEFPKKIMDEIERVFS